MKNPTKIIISNMALAILIIGAVTESEKPELDAPKLLAIAEPPKFIVWGNSVVSLSDSQLIPNDIIIKIMKEPILPNFLPFKATFPITIQKYISIKKYNVAQVELNILYTITPSWRSLK